MWLEIVNGGKRTRRGVENGRHVWRPYGGGDARAPTPDPSPCWRGELVERMCGRAKTDAPRVVPTVLRSWWVERTPRMASLQGGWIKWRLRVRD